ncbi:MAG: hypothetical protein WBO36_11260 [Saprospiraceae bacterium]
MKQSIVLFKIIGLTLFAFSNAGCSQPLVEIQSQNKYEGCCGTEPRIFKVEDYVVYIPNIITPNGDGINDVFYPRCNVMKNGKFAVASFFMYDDTSKLIYALPGLNVESADAWGFKGVANKRPSRPEVHLNFEYTGKFKYSFYLAFLLKDNTEELIFVEGEACVVRCDEDARIIKGKGGCYFPVQGIDGIYNAGIPSSEDNCIK